MVEDYEKEDRGLAAERTAAISRWADLLEERRGDPALGVFSNFFLADADEQKMRGMLDALRENSRPDTYLEIDLQPDDQTLSELLKRYRKRLKGSLVVVVVKGFEKVFAYSERRYDEMAMGHLWYQRLGKDYCPDLVKYLARRKTHVAVITTIGASAGMEVYRRAKISASTCQFTQGSILV